MSQANAIDTAKLEQLILQHLPILIEQSPKIQELVFELSAHKKQTTDWFHQILDELRRDREAQTKKWDEQNRKWEEQNRKWEEQNRKWEEQNRKLDDQNRKWDEQNRKWDEQNRKWDEQNRKWDDQSRKWDDQSRKWDEQERNFNKVHEEIMELARKHDRSIDALGARWGLQAESAFRNALAAILEQSFGVKVLNINEFDDEGMVFGRPDQVELDVIIKNGLLIICEIKSSMSKSDIYTFERKVRFYEQRHQRKATRMIVISPMVDLRAKPAAEKLGIEVYSDSSEVNAEL
jgi:hypothetical protein